MSPFDAAFYYWTTRKPKHTNHETIVFNNNKGIAYLSLQKAHKQCNHNKQYTKLITFLPVTSSLSLSSASFTACIRLRQESGLSSSSLSRIMVVDVFDFLPFPFSFPFSAVKPLAVSLGELFLHLPGVSPATGEVFLAFLHGILLKKSSNVAIFYNLCMCKY